MTWLHSHWWWFMLVGGVGDVASVLGLGLLRYHRLMICRTHWRLRFAWEPVSLGCLMLFWLAISPLWLVNIIWGVVAFCELSDLMLKSDSWAVRLTWPDFNPPFVVVADGPTRTFREMRAHRHHDEDCEFGPRRHPFAGRLKHLVTWRKVSLNPVFRPA